MRPIKKILKNFGVEDIRLTDKLISELPGILNWSIEGLQRLLARGHFPSETEVAKTDLVKKLQQGKRNMADRCKRVGDLIIRQAGVKEVQHHNGLSGQACPASKLNRIPEPTTRRRLYIVAREAGHVALNLDGAKPAHREAYEAEKFAHDALRRNGIAVPKKSTHQGKRFVAQNVRLAVKGGAKIDRESYRWCQRELGKTF